MKNRSTVYSDAQEDFPIPWYRVSKRGGEMTCSAARWVWDRSGSVTCFIKVLGAEEDRCMCRWSDGEYEWSLGYCGEQTLGGRT
ncbi:hypothetical protein BDU57DRAFT_514279, partial [Ampelomyces quisqualis]